MANVPISNLTTTWNNVSTTFTGVKLNVTDTASAAGSLLMDLQVGGASRFNVTKGGAVRVANGSPSAVAYGFASDATTGLYYASSNDLRLTVVGFDAVSLSQTTLRLQSATSQFGFGTGAGDLFVARDAADTLAQRRGVNAQTFRLYNTFTDASNYERGKFEWASNVLRIGTEKAGTGTARNLEFQTDGVTRLTISASGPVDVVNGNITLANDVRLSRRASGVLLLDNNGGSDFGRLQFGGTTSSFPALKRSTTSLQARLADDSAFTNIQGKLTTETAYTAGAPTATGYLVLYDSNGTAYKVPAEAL
jgi:hypothetical protein